MMMTIRFTATAFGLLWTLLMVQPVVAAEEVEHDRLFQVATLQALLDGNYDGSFTLKALGEQGDVGLGTLDHLDGEMVAVDGQFFQIAVDGTVRQPSDATTTPFAMVKRFAPEQQLPLAAGLDLAGVQANLLAQMGDLHYHWVIRLDGTFSTLKTRSVPRQNPPYRLLSDVVKEQRFFEFKAVTGTVVGVHIPETMSGVNLPGFHFHFITQDRTAGGHLLAITTGSNVVARLDNAPSFTLRFSTTPIRANSPQDSVKTLKLIEQDPMTRR